MRKEKGKAIFQTLVFVCTPVALRKQEEWWNQTLPWLEEAYEDHFLWASASPSGPVWIKPPAPLKDGMMTQEMHASCPGHGSRSRTVVWHVCPGQGRVPADHSGEAHREDNVFAGKCHPPQLRHPNIIKLPKTVENSGRQTFQRSDELPGASL